MNTDARLTAKLLSACPPDSAQKEKLEAWSVDNPLEEEINEEGEA